MFRFLGAVLCLVVLSGMSVASASNIVSGVVVENGTAVSGATMIIVAADASGKPIPNTANVFSADERGWFSFTPPSAMYHVVAVSNSQIAGQFSSRDANRSIIIDLARSVILPASDPKCTCYPFFFSIKYVCCTYEGQFYCYYSWGCPK